MLDLWVHTLGGATTSAAPFAPLVTTIARAIVAAAEASELTPGKVENFKSTAGQGVSGEIDGTTIEVLRDATASCRVLADGRQIGTITVADEARTGARAAIAELASSALSLAARSCSAERG